MSLGRSRECISDTRLMLNKPIEQKLRYDLVRRLDYTGDTYVFRGATRSETSFGQ